MTKKIFKIKGMHCTSCAFNIDGELEDADGVEKSATNYAKQETIVSYDPKKIKAEKIIAIIKEVGYDVATVH
jgi:Cu+-exporting ATPase